MSNLTKTAEQECDFIPGEGPMLELVEPRLRKLGGLSVRRALPSREQQMVGPWIYLDHMEPAGFDAGEGINVPPHPHIGLCTMTYLFTGEVLHRDSLGSLQSIRPGDVNLMVAGRGIVHSEREPDEVHSLPHKLHGLQLWLALPREQEEIPPEFHHYPAGQIPELERDGAMLRVIMGRAYGAGSPVKTFAQSLFVEARMQAGQAIALPDAEERAVYVVSGRLRAGGMEIPPLAMAIFREGAGVELAAIEESHIVILGGERFDRRCILWNFVSSRPERIDQAVEEWRAGRYPRVHGDEEAYIPFPET